MNASLGKKADMMGIFFPADRKYVKQRGHKETLTHKESIINSRNSQDNEKTHLIKCNAEKVSIWKR